jgi:hypothetical protein
MNPDPTPAAGEPPWEALEALAAGELPADEARALRARLAIEPDWQAAWRRVESVEGLLRQEPLLALPLALLPATLARVLPLEPVRPWQVAARAAAAILVFCASWFAFSGRAPALADVGPRPEMAAGLGVRPTLPPLAALLSGGPGGGVVACAVGGVLTLVTGIVLGVRWHRAAARGARA